MTLEDLDREIDFCVASINAQITYLESHPERNCDTSIIDAISERRKFLKTVFEFRKSLQDKTKEFKTFQKTLWKVGIFRDRCGHLICKEKEDE